MLLGVRLLGCLLLPLLQRGKGSPDSQPPGPLLCVAAWGVSARRRPGGQAEGLAGQCAPTASLARVSPLSQLVCAPAPLAPLGGCSGQGLPHVSLPMGLVKPLCPGCKGQGRARSILLSFPLLGWSPWVCSGWPGRTRGVWCAGITPARASSWLDAGAVAGCAALAPFVSLLQGVGTLSTGTSRRKVRPRCHRPSVTLAMAATHCALLLVGVSAPLGDRDMSWHGPAGPASTDSTVCPYRSLLVHGRGR